MRREQCKRLAGLLTAYGDGCDIQIRKFDKTWVDYTPLDFASLYAIRDAVWRVKPTPREYWVAVFKSETHSEHRAFESRESVMERHSNNPYVCEIIHVREIE